MVDGMAKTNDKEQTMNKHDCIWVAIRVFGIFLIVHALMAIPSLVGSVYNACSYWQSFSGGSPSLAALRNSESFAYSQGIMFRTTFCKLLTDFMQVVVSVVGGVYLLRGGNKLFVWICPQQTLGK